jgi:molybdopterin synthase sulfur carrier subunit
LRQYLSGECVDVDQSRVAGRRAAGCVGGVVVVVTVRYWASARAAAGRSEDLVCGSSVADVLDAVRRVHGENPALLRALGVSSLLLGDLPLGSRDLSAVPVQDGDVVEVLPPFAGG